MKIKVTIVFIVFFISSILLTESCRKCEGSQVYKVVGLNFHVTGAQYDANSEPKMYYFDIYNDSIFFSFYGILLEPVKQLYAANYYPSLSLINTTYACDPVLNTMENQIADIQIITDKDFDDSHPKGINIAEYFDIVVSYEHTNEYYTKYSLLDFLAKKPHVPDQMTLILNTKPKKDSEFNFHLMYSQEGSDLTSLDIDLGKITIVK